MQTLPWAIDDENGNELSAGLDEHTARRLAQQFANERDEPVSLYQGSSEAEIIEPVRVKEFAARAKFFAGHGVETRKVRVATDGTVRVWDSVAGHYTLCHSLTPSAVRRIRSLAVEVAP